LGGSEKKTGVLLLNLGGPDSLQAVKPFLFNLFSDRDIIRLGPAPLQKPIAFLISLFRSGKTKKAYSLIGGKSPISEITSAQAKALEQALGLLPPTPGFRSPGVSVAMRYWHPLIEDVIPDLHAAGIRRLIVLSLYPQYSVATTGSSLNRLGDYTSKYGIETFNILSWFDHPLYIDAIVQSIRDGLQAFGSEEGAHKIRVLFSAHSLPVKFITEGDPYEVQIKGTIDEVIKKIDIDWSLSYQSKSGPVEWLGPSTDEMIEHLAAEGVKNLLVVPISFVSDHIETLYEIDILYRDMARGLGIRLERVNSLNTSPLFISALLGIVCKGMKEAGWAE
jgi:protoporphyrin/coproporphyrin ferrochelatase